MQNQLVILRGGLEVQFTKYCTCAHPGELEQLSQEWTECFTSLELEPYMLKASSWTRQTDWVTLSFHRITLMNAAETRCAINVTTLLQHLLHNDEISTAGGKTEEKFRTKVRTKKIQLCIGSSFSSDQIIDRVINKLIGVVAVVCS